MIISNYCEWHLRSITEAKHNLENSYGREAEVLAVYVVACKLSLEDILPHRQSEQVGEGIIGNDFVLLFRMLSLGPLWRDVVLREKRAVHLCRSACNMYA